MIKLFFITFFIAELIIVLTVVMKIYHFNKFINALNEMICTNKYKISAIFLDFRSLLEDFSKGILQLKECICQKRTEYSLKILKTSLSYAIFFMLSGKYRKTIIAYQFFKEIYDGVKES